eukprot:gene15-555_t
MVNYGKSGVSGRFFGQSKPSAAVRPETRRQRTVENFVEERKHSLDMGGAQGAQMLFNMHTVKIQDLLEFDRLPSFDEVQSMNKFVVLRADKANPLYSHRPIVFVSHQWCGYRAPDPTNRQFEVLKGALQSLREGRIVYPSEFAIGLPGVPSKGNFSSLLKNCLVWIDYVSVPQLRARHHSDDSSPGDQEHDASRLQNMLSAINSVPAYIQRSSLTLILAPVVIHKEEGTDCQLSTWKNRGWCRLEAVVSSLVSKSKSMVLVESRFKMSLFSAHDMLYRDSVGCGEYACCKRNHLVEVDGVEVPIACDRGKVSAVLENLYETQLLERCTKKDLSDFRWLLAHEHILLKNLPSLDTRPQYDSWSKFANAFQLNAEKPLQKVGGKHNCIPLIYAVIANNFPVVKYLIELKSNVNETIGKARGTTCRGYAPLHFNMKVGHGESGRKIFDLLISAGADPYQYSYGGSMLRKAFYRDPLTVGIAAYNQEMCIHYLNAVQVNFLQYADKFGSANEHFIASKGLYAVFMEALQHGATFQSRNPFGVGALGMCSITSRENELRCDIRVFDELHQRGLLPNLDEICHNQSRRTFLIYGSIFHLRNSGFLKSKAMAKVIYSIFQGTYLHIAVYGDKPEMVAWLMNHRADPKRTNKRGQTPLDLARELGSQRCAAVLLGDQKAVRRYSLS